MTDIETVESPLLEIEPRLRDLLPADLYAEVWVDPSSKNLVRVFEHLRTLQHILADYVPRELFQHPPLPGHLRKEWIEGTLMFTDLAGFTPLLEANAQRGKEGVSNLLKLINDYFATMIEIVSKSGGSLLEFTGDAMLVQFPVNRKRDETQQAIRAGLRMQRAMEEYKNIRTYMGKHTLGMRVGIHHGRFLMADIGTPHRMEHVLLGKCVQETKRAEGAGVVGRVNLTAEAFERVKDDFRTEPGTTPGYMLVIDDLSNEALGSYEIGIRQRRVGGGVLFDRSVDGLLKQIAEMMERVEPVASYIPRSILNVLVEQAHKREVPPEVPEPTVVFVNLKGLPESVDDATPDEIDGVISRFSGAFARINAAVESRGGVLKKVTYHLAGSDMMIFFGVPNAHTNDSIRAIEAAQAIRKIILDIDPPSIGGKEIQIECQIGMAQGQVFAAEVGELRGRREFNILGDTVNTAARLMGKAVGNRILMTEAVRDNLPGEYFVDSLGSMPLKGKTMRLPLFALSDKPVKKHESALFEKLFGDDVMG